MAEALADANLAEAAFCVKGTAGGIFRHDLGLEGPVRLRFRGADESEDERDADTLFLCVLIDVNADLSDAGRPSRVGNRGEGRPTVHGIPHARDDPAERQVRSIPFVLRWRVA